MSNDLMRRQAFYLLKKYSSLTWFEEIHRQYAQFTAGWETYLRNIPAGTPGVSQDEESWRSFLAYQSSMEDGLAALSRGERVAAYSSLLAGCRFYEYLWGRRFSDTYDFSDMGWRDETEVNSGIFEWAQRAACMVGYGGVTVFSRLRWLSYLLRDSEARKSEIHRLYIDDQLDIPFGLPSIPDTVPVALNVTVLSNEEIPISGIWQVESVNGKAVDEMDYCMNYLVAGNEAPEMISNQEYEMNSRFVRLRDESARAYYNKIKPYAVCWRLLWEDDRYLDGGRPAEESDYLKPQAPQGAVLPTQRVANVLGGQPCTHEGFWWTPAIPDSRRHFKQGENMPVATDPAWGETIWQFDQNPLA